jgi:hypothetical protein
VLKTCASRRLRTEHWNVTVDALSKVIWALDSLPCLITAHIDIETPVPSDQECSMLGSAPDLPLRLSNLQQFLLLITRFHHRVFRENCGVGHALSASGISQYDPPDVVVFITAHGLNLVVLDLNFNVYLPLLMYRRSSISAQLLPPSHLTHTGE